MTTPTTFETWCAKEGGYLNDPDDAAKAARLMARKTWEAATQAATLAEREACAQRCEILRDMTLGNSPRGLVRESAMLMATSCANVIRKSQTA